MKIKYIWVTIALSLAAAIATIDTNAQYRRHSGRYYPGGYYGGGPRVSVGIGGLFGFGRWGSYYGGPNVGISVMLPPIVLGSRVHSLPPGSRRIYYGGVLYYYRNNSYYRQRESGDGYEIVEPPLGATLERLPSGARKRVINGNIYYEYNGDYYRVDTDGSREVYIVVGKGGRLDTDEALRRRAESREDIYDNDGYEDNDNDYRNDRSYNRRSADTNNNEIIVRNANEDDEYVKENDRDKTTRNSTDEVYSSGPQAGDRFENLPRNTKTISVNGQTQYESPAGTRYKKVDEDGKTLYEVIKAK